MNSKNYMRKKIKFNYILTCITYCNLSHPKFQSISVKGQRNSFERKWQDSYLIEKLLHVINFI